MPANSAEILRTWASLSEPSSVDWSPVTQIIQVAEAESQRLESTLKELLKTSDARLRSFSLCDPLLADAGLNRWLKKEREEAYSDWLAWIFEQLDKAVGAAGVLKVLGIDEPTIPLNEHTHFAQPERERIITAGRLDIVLTLGELALIVIEVKKYSAESSDTAKQAGYYEWLQSQQVTHRMALLLTSDAAEEKYEEFSVLLWADVCIWLRRMLPELAISLGPVKAAMFVAFISAVETNILDLVAPEPDDTVERLFYAKSIEHLRRYLEDDGHGRP